MVREREQAARATGTSILKSFFVNLSPSLPPTPHQQNQNAQIPSPSLLPLPTPSHHRPPKRPHSRSTHQQLSFRPLEPTGDHSPWDSHCFVWNCAGLFHLLHALAPFLGFLAPPDVPTLPRPRLPLSAVTQTSATRVELQNGFSEIKNLIVSMGAIVKTDQAAAERRSEVCLFPLTLRFDFFNQGMSLIHSLLAPGRQD